MRCGQMRQDHGPQDRTGLTIFADPDDCMRDREGRFAAATGGLSSSPTWYRTVVDSGMAPGARPCFAVWNDRSGPAAIFPLRREADGQVHGLTTPYTCLYGPLLAPDLDRTAIRLAGFALGRFCRPAVTVRLDALDPASPQLAPLLEGVQRAGLIVSRFDHFGNWRQSVAGLSWRAYLETRPGALRQTVRRKLARFERDPQARIEIIAGPEGLEAGIAAFEAVYRRSWKEPEPFPDFNAALMRHTAPSGQLRLGILRLAETPIAAQFWIVADGHATVLKLAHDEACKPMSPGTVLTAVMLRRLLDAEHVRTVDFGRGDDPYKRLWASERRQRIGVLLINPLHPRGMAALGRQVLGRGRRVALSLLRPAGAVEQPA